MGLWQLLAAGYDANPELWNSYPLSTTTIAWKSNSFAVILLRSDGSFVKSWMLPKSPVQEIMAPGTQGSLGRTSTAIRPHALFDSRAYVFPSKATNRSHTSVHGQNDASPQKRSKKTKKQVADNKFEEYRKQLKNFAESSFATEKIKAVYRYVSSNPDIEVDLPPGTDDKTFILFAVEICGDPITNLWEDPAVYKAWSDYYSSNISQNAKELALDFVTGTQQQPSQSHPRNILSSAYAAKLISANDASNFSFRGIFHHPNDLQGQERDDFINRFGLSDAVTIGYESSQKAHQFLRYLIASHGIPCGGQVIVPFANRTGAKSLPPPPVSDDDEDWDQEEIITTADVMTKLGANTGLDYAKSLGKALAGFKPDRLVEAHAPTAIAIFESATPGRLSVTYYRELARDEYLENVRRWHESCKWPIWRKAKDSGKPFVVFGAPSFERILQASFGWSKSATDTGYQKLRQRVRAQLIRSVFDNAPLPADFVSNAICRASNPLAVTTDGQFDRNRFISALATTCALLKHNTQNTKESFDMSIDLSRTDRDYLYGRLLGAADKLEEYALHKKDNSRLVTAAIRYMQTFSMRPATTWRIIHDSLLPYKQQVKNSVADRELQNIYANLSAEASENDSPLSGVYLAGYYHERSHIDDLISKARSRKSDADISNDNQQEQE